MAHSWEWYSSITNIMFHFCENTWILPHVLPRDISQTKSKRRDESIFKYIKSAFNNDLKSVFNFSNT